MRGTRDAIGAGMRIIVDAGHGGSAPAGRSTPYGVRGKSGTFEKDVTLALAQRLERRLGQGVVLTRAEDTNLSLAERCGLGA